jgi:hypothetical protein
MCTALSFCSQPQRRSTPRRRRRPLLAREEIGWEMADKFCLWPNFHVIKGFFNMLQICDMGQTALLPFQRNTCWGLFRQKIRHLQPGANPRSWVSEASMLTTRPPKPLSYRGSNENSRNIYPHPHKKAHQSHICYNFLITSNLLTCISYFLQLYWLSESGISLHRYTKHINTHRPKWANIPHHLTVTGWYSFHVGPCTVF